MKKLFGKEENKTRPKKYATRNLYLKGVGAFLVTIFLVLGISFFTKQKQAFDTDDLINADLVSGAKMYRVDTKYDPQQQLLITQYYIGDKSDVDSQVAASDLANLTYKVKAATINKKITPNTTQIRVNDHYLVVINKNLAPGFKMVQLQINPVAINKSLGKDDAQECDFILDESKLKTYKNLRIETKAGYQAMYNYFLSEQYKSVLNKQAKIVKNAKNKIKGDNQLIEKLKGKIATADSDDSSDLSQQITNAQNDIDDQQSTIKSAETIIANTNKQLNSIETSSSIN